MPKLNILPKKSWHVYSTANREKVRRDEEKARIEEEKEQQKQQKREKDFRLETLRHRAKERGKERVDDSENPETLSLISEAKSTPEKHINLFEEQEQAFLTATEKESMKLKKLQDQFTVYLDKKDPKGDPWYLNNQRESSSTSKAGIGSDAKRLIMEDPMSQFSSDFGHSSKTSKSDKMTVKYKDAANNENTSKIEKLRQERIERERSEKLRALKITNPREYNRQMAEIKGNPYRQGWRK